MSKKTFIAIIAISFAMIAMATGQRLAKAESQYAPQTSFASGLTVYSPLHTNYDDENQPIWCNISISSSMGTQIGWGTYEIDGIPQGEIPNSSSIIMNGNSYSVSASFLLPKLPDGHHWISFPIVTGTYPNSITYNNEVDFTVEPTPSPSISSSPALSPPTTVGQTPTFTPNPSPAQSQSSPTPIITNIVTLSPSPTQQLIREPSPTASPSNPLEATGSSLSVEMGGLAVALVTVATGLMVYFRKKRKTGMARRWNDFGL